MRKTLNILLALAGILVGAIASPGKQFSTSDNFHNVVVVDGLHVALPNDIKKFPFELVPIP
jgi:hypothetical protein